MYPNKLYPKVLLISDATWSDKNNIGNTFTNLFADWPKDKIAMIYTRPNLPNTNVCNNFFQISENRLIKNLINKNVKAGKKLSIDDLKKSTNESLSLRKDEISGKRVYQFFTKYRWNIFLIAREILWKIGSWKNEELDSFVNDFNPDIIFSLACSGIYINELQQYIIKKANKKSVIYFVDDIYSTKQFSLSPLFWINKLLIRKSIKRTVGICDLAYTIIYKQQHEYKKYFNINIEILNKGWNFDEPLKKGYKPSFPLKLVYTGNIYAGRWETLVKIGKALDQINNPEQKALLYVYTQNHLDADIDKAFHGSKSIKFMGAIPVNTVKEVQDNADILIHVESLKYKERLLTRLSFSTKLVDYFERGKCIFAVGWKNAASIDYLVENQAAIVVNDYNNLQSSLERLINNPELIEKYGNRSWELGKRNHQIDEIKNKLYQDLKSLIEEDKNEGITN